MDYRHKLFRVGQFSTPIDRRRLLDDPPTPCPEPENAQSRDQPRTISIPSHTHPLKSNTINQIAQAGVLVNDTERANHVRNPEST